MDYFLYILSVVAFSCTTLYFVGNNYKYWTIYILAAIMAVSLSLKAETYYSFKYNTKDQLKVSVQATDYFEARTKASKICFRALTGGKYQGEEAGLDAIDLCANPVK